MCNFPLILHIFFDWVLDRPAFIFSTEKVKCPLLGRGGDL